MKNEAQDMTASTMNGISNANSPSCSSMGVENPDGSTQHQQNQQNSNVMQQLSPPATPTKSFVSHSSSPNYNNNSNGNNKLD